jgi:hypothetical protein
VQPKLTDLSDTDQKLMNLNPQQSKQLVNNIQQSFPRKQCSEKDWDRNVNNFVQEQKKPSFASKEIINKNHKSFYPKGKFDYSNKNKKFKKNQKPLSLKDRLLMIRKKEEKTN